MRSELNPIGDATALCSATLAAIVAASASADFLPPSAAMKWTVNGGEPSTLSVNGTSNLSGNYSFVKTVTNGTTKVTFNYVADINPSGNAVINGSTTFENNGPSTIEVTTNFEVDICPTVSASLIGGIASVKLICNADGGLLTCGPAGSWAATAWSNDGADVYPLYFCPFEIVKTGAGTTTSNVNFGLPIPSAPGPGDLSSLGHGTNFTLSPGDKAVFTLMYATNGQINYQFEDPCQGDVTGDSMVNKDDLIEVLSLFGQTVQCGNPADCNGDGVVGSEDLGLVTGFWGPCPG